MQKYDQTALEAPHTQNQIDAIEATDWKRLALRDGAKVFNMTVAAKKLLKELKSRQPDPETDALILKLETALR